MPYSPLNGFEEIEPTTQVDTWGNTENRNKERLDQALDGFLDIEVDGDRSIVYSNGTEDERHYSGFNVTSGIGGALIFQATQGVYVIRNGIAGNVTVKTNVGANTVIQPGAVATVMIHPTVGAQQVSPDGSDLKAITDGILTAAKTYTDNASFDSASAQLPGQAGSAGMSLYTDGTVAGWRNSQIPDVAGLPTRLVSDFNFLFCRARR